MTRNKSLDGLRTIAFLMVFISHIPRLEIKYNNSGMNAVSVFIILSGYLCASSYRHLHAEKEISDISFDELWCRGGGYLLKGIKKFYFVHLITFGASAILQIYWLIKFGSSFKSVVAAIEFAIPNIFLFHSYIPDGNYYFSYNSVSWYLSDTLFFYFMSPFLMWFANKITHKKKIKNILILLWGLEIVISVVLRNSTEQVMHAVLYISPFFRVVDFYSGILMFRLGEMRNKNFQSRSEEKYGQIWQVVAGCFFGIAVIYWRYIPKSLSYSALFSPIAFSLIYTLVYTKGVISSILANRILAGFSTICFEAYMVHQVIINYVREFEILHGRLPEALYFLIIFGGVFMVSCILHWLNGWHRKLVWKI